MKSLLVIILAIALILYSLTGIYEKGRPGLVEQLSWKYSLIESENWHKIGFNDGEWKKASIPIKADKMNKKNIYIRGKILFPSGNFYAKAYADDCIKEFYVNGKRIYKNIDCTPCLDCKGKKIDLKSAVEPGENLVAIKVGNTGGPMNLNEITFERKKLVDSPLFIDDYFHILCISASLLILIIYSLRRFGLEHVITTILLFALISTLFLSPILKNIHHWGRHDWNSVQFYLAVPRQTIIKFHQFPLWNPYYCGGNPLLAHPAPAFLSPFFIFTLIFDVIPSIKLLILIHMIIGLYGIYILSKYLGLSTYSSYLASFVYTMNSCFTLAISEGHFRISYAWIPFVFLFYLKSKDDIKNIIPASVFLLLVILSGGHPIILVFTILFLLTHTIFKTIQDGKISNFIALLLILALTFSLGAVKFLPTIEYIGEHKRLIKKDTSAYTPEIFYTALLNREQSYGAHHLPGQVWGWHEYGAYLGGVVIVLSLFGAVVNLRKMWPLILSGLVFILITFGHNSPVDLWEFMRGLPVIKSFHVPSKIRILFILPVSIFAGMGLTQVEKRSKIVALFAVLFVLGNFFLVNSPALEYPFTIAPKDIGWGDEFYHVVEKRGAQCFGPDLYGIFLSGRGALNCYEHLRIPAKAMPKYKRGILNKGYKGEAFLLNDRGDAMIYYFSPNKVVVNVNATREDTLILNQNFHKGWHVKGSSGVVESTRGLVSTQVTPKDKRVTFYYLPYSFIIGLILSTITIPITAYLLIKRDWIRNRIKKTVSFLASIRIPTKKKLAVIIFFAVVIRLAYIGTIPAGMNQDEVVNGYDAYSILKTGRDHWGKRFPIFFRHLGEYNEGMHRYSMIPWIYLNDLNPLSVRLTSAIWGVATIFIAFLLGRELFDSRVGLLTSLFLALSPWHMHFSRLGYRAITLPFFITLGLYLLHKGLKDKKSFLAGAAVMGLSFYTYGIARLYTPLLILGFVVLYHRRLWRIRKTVLLSTIIFLLVATPFIYYVTYYQKQLTWRFRVLTILKPGRSMEEILLKFEKNMLAHYSLEYLFTKGRPWPVFSQRGFGMMQQAMMIPLALGVVYCLLSRRRECLLLLWMLLIFPVSSSLTQEGIPHPLRSIVGLPVLQLITAVLLIRCIDWSRRFSKIKILLMIFMILYAVDVLQYVHHYFFEYPTYSAKSFYAGVGEGVVYLEGMKDNYSAIVISNKIRIPYIQYLFYTKKDPKIFQEKLRRGLIGVKFCNEKKCCRGNVLCLIKGRDKSYPKTHKMIYYPDGTPAFSVVEGKRG